jgi:hypothetical protein
MKGGRQVSTTMWKDRNQCALYAVRCKKMSPVNVRYGASFAKSDDMMIVPTMNLWV